MCAKNLHSVNLSHHYSFTENTSNDIPFYYSKYSNVVFHSVFLRDICFKKQLITCVTKYRLIRDSIIILKTDQKEGRH